MLEEIKIKTGEIVSSSSEAGKVIDNFYCYIACSLKNKNLDAIDAKVGTNIKIRLSNAQEITSTIEYMTKESDDESLVVLKINKSIEELINYRKISLEILWWSETGLKVPVEAIHYENDLPYVIRKRVGYTDNIYVKILKKNEKYAIIKNFTYDELKEKGFDAEKLNNRKTISLYDELEI